jgi:hypothetical protein
MLKWRRREQMAELISILAGEEGKWREINFFKK